MQAPIINVIDNYKELSSTEKIALSFITEHYERGLNASKLARHLGLELSSTSKILKELKDCHLIHTERVGKELVIEPLSAGRELADKINEKKSGVALVMFL